MVTAKDLWILTLGGKGLANLTVDKNNNNSDRDNDVATMTRVVILVVRHQSAI